MADKKRWLIVITPQEIRDDEAVALTALLNNGVDFVHLRHPGATLPEVRHLIESIPQKLHSKLRLHGHFELLNEFNLGGIHLNSRCTEAPHLYRGSVSKTCHSIEEAISICDDVDFLTLSPICDSISKPGYRSLFTDGQLASIPSGKVVALGGITPECISRLNQHPFIGYATLGYIWEAHSGDDMLARLNKLKALL